MALKGLLRASCRHGCLLLQIIKLGIFQIIQVILKPLCITSRAVMFA